MQMKVADEEVLCDCLQRLLHHQGGRLNFVSNLFWLVESLVAMGKAGSGWQISSVSSVPRFTRNRPVKPQSAQLR